MAKLLKLRRGSTSQHGSFTGAEGEVTVDTDKDTLVVHDGSTAGGHPVAAEDMANVSAANIKGRLGTTLTNAEINASAAIAGTKIAPDFGSQNVATTGTISGSSLTLSNNNLIINGTQPQISFVDSDGNPDYLIKTNGGVFDIRDNTSDASRLSVQSDGHVDVAGNLDVGAGVDVTGNITVTGTVDGVDVAALDSTVGALGLTGNTLANGVHGTTQSQGDNSTKIATTAYTDTAVANLVDSAPGALNTLNELAAALGDDANFSTTVTNSIAAKLPLAGGTMSGNLTIGGSNIIFGDSSSAGTNLNRLKLGAGNDFNIYHDGSGNNFIQSINNHDLIVRAGTGDAYVQGSDVFLGNAGGSKKYLDAHEDGAVELYHSNSKKAETVSGGFTVTGTCTATAFAGDGSALTGIVSFVSGMIIMYNSTSAPSGWYLCDGNNGTPDLRDRFIVGAGNSYSQNATGGSNTATDTVNISGSDTVSITVSGNCSLSGSGVIGSGFNYGSSTISFSGTGTDTVNISGSDTVSIDTRSPYYALTFIMKA